MFSVAKPDETTGKETEFSLVGSLEIKKKNFWLPKGLSEPP